ncbi:large ribosomal RNA subunit accumulation protein YCED homolog 1, chloroplastic [Silene latifolia]|uniref:large ribosomal RNA subunit accumulation protein YCED homolog 1, chloroplastic n=1 Tax=Silene latifolia TaxID=37657 RepID=UPI003D7847ED
MSVHYLSSINPILNNNNNNNNQRGCCLKTQIQNLHCIHPFTTVPILFKKPYNNLVSRQVLSPKSTEEEITYDFDLGDEEDDDEGSPWEGSVVYRRNSSISHIEYCTTLESLGLAKLSSQLSTSTASTMGLRVTKSVKDYLDGTPVLVSVDITRKKRKLRLDGIIRTVITLSCYRCGEAAAESVFSNFSLLLTEEPVEEPDTINFGTMYGDEKTKSTSRTGENEEDEDDALIDIEDRLYFPPEEKEIDISKQIRDLIHLEITINSICDSRCKGLCLQCGTNLNTSKCSCGKQETVDAGFGPLGGLRDQMKHK